MAVKQVGAAATAALVTGSLVLMTQHGSATAGTSTPAQLTTASSGYHLVWSDEFNGSSLSSKWMLTPTGANSGRTCASASKRTTKVSGGKAKLSADVDRSRRGSSSCSKYYLNSQLKSTKRFLYGTFSARIKFQSQRGMHGAFWLLPSGPAPSGVSSSNLAGYRGVEMDVAEYFGDLFGASPKGGLYSYIYYPKRTVTGETMVKQSGNTAKATKVVGKKKASGGFHTYTMEWTPTQYIFSIDGKETARINVGVSHHAEELRLSMLTSDWELRRLTKSSLPASMQVDWVRVYQK